MNNSFQYLYKGSKPGPNFPKSQRTYVEKNGKSLELCIRDECNFIVAWQAGMSEEEIDDILKRHPGWRRSGEYMSLT